MQQHIARQRGLARTTDPSDGHQAAQWQLHINLAQVVQKRAVQVQAARCHRHGRAAGRAHVGGAQGIGLGFFAGRAEALGLVGGDCGSAGRQQRQLGLAHAAPRLHGVSHGVQQVAPGLRIGLGADLSRCALGHQTATALACTRANVDDVVGVANGFFVVLNHHQGVALVAQGLEGLEQNLVVARMQANGGFVEHVANALQLAAQLGRQTDALGFATAQGGCAPVQGEVAQAHFFQKRQAPCNFGHQVAGNVGRATAQGQTRHPLAHTAHAQAGNVGDGLALKAHRPRGGVQTAALARWARGVGEVFHLGLGKALLAPSLLVVAHRVVQGLALVAGELQTSAHTVWAPAVLAVVREQTRVQLAVGRGTHGASPLGGKHLHLANALGGGGTGHGFAQTVQTAEHMHHALAVFQRQRQVLAQRGLVAGLDLQAGDGQLDGVLFEAIDARESGGGQKVAVHPQMGVATWARPVGQLGVDAFAVDHQGAEQTNVLTPVGFHQLGDDALRGLGLHRRAVVHTVLGAELHIEQAQKVPYLGGGAHGAFAPTARQALFDGHRGWDAIHRVHLGPSRRLHDAARIGVQAFQVAALALVEQNVKRQSGLARTADAGDHIELTARNVHAQVAQVVLAGVDDADAFFQRLAQVLGRWLLHQAQGQAAGRRRGVGIGQRRGVGTGGKHLAHGLGVFAQSARGVRAGVLAHLFGMPLDHHTTAGVTALGPQVNQPVTGADHIEVVFDDDERMPGFEQAAQSAHEFGNVVKVQTGGGLVEQKPGAFARQALPALAG